MDAEQSGEGLGLGITKLGKLAGHMLHRAVPLADLDAVRLAIRAWVPYGSGGGGEAFLAQRLRQGVGPGGGVTAHCGETSGIPALEVGNPPGRERSHRIVTQGVREESQGVPSEIVVVGDQRPLTGRGDDPGAGRATTTPGAMRLPWLDQLRLLQVVEVTADRGLGQSQLGDDSGRLDRAALADEPEHPMAGVLLGLIF